MESNIVGTQIRCANSHEAREADGAEFVEDYGLARNAAVLRERLLSHPIYESLDSVARLRAFMANHVFAVWDFMSLLKELQRRLTCVDVPWLPPADTSAARLINEIVLAEETDEVTPGQYVGHFHLYLAAMREIDADSGAIRDFVSALRGHTLLAEVLARLPILEATRGFVAHNLNLLNRPTHELAAAFLYGREDIIPGMFTGILRVLEQQGLRCDTFRLYLARHVQIDAEQHAPMARKLLASICGTHSDLWADAARAATDALAARRDLWDGILAGVRAVQTQR